MAKTHPIVEPLRKWLSENERVLDSATLGEPRKYNIYLENRIREAFQAGWNAHVTHLNNTGDHNG